MLEMHPSTHSFSVLKVNIRPHANSVKHSKKQEAFFFLAVLAKVKDNDFHGCFGSDMNVSGEWSFFETIFLNAAAAFKCWKKDVTPYAVTYSKCFHC